MSVHLKFDEGGNPVPFSSLDCGMTPEQAASVRAGVLKNAPAIADPGEVPQLVKEHICAVLGGVIGTLTNYSTPEMVLAAIEEIYAGRHELMKRHAQVRAAFIAGISRAANEQVSG